MKSCCTLMTIVLGWIFLSAGAAYADEDSAKDMGSDGSGASARMAHGRRLGGKRGGSHTASRSPSTVRGSCSIVESPSNPFPGPCVNLLLILTDTADNTAIRTRTTPQGRFDFAVEKGKTYKIEPDSKSYSVVNPGGTIQGGENLALKLQQK